MDRELGKVRTTSKQTQPLVVNLFEDPLKEHSIIGVREGGGG